MSSQINKINDKATLLLPTPLNKKKYEQRGLTPTPLTISLFVF